MELKVIKGCGPKTITYLNKLGIYDVDSLVRFYPYRYNVYTKENILDINDEDTHTISGLITSLPNVAYFRGMNRVTFNVESNNIPISVTIFNRSFLVKNLTIGKGITLIGKYNKLKNNFIASDIKLFYLNKTIVEPVYHKVSGLTSNTITKCINNALENNVTIEEIVPTYITNKYELMGTKEAIKEIHNPSNSISTKKAKLKLKYEELFSFMFKINLIKYKDKIFDDFVIKSVNQNDLDKILSMIPFDLTTDQLEAIKEIMEDYNKLKRMNRLILGDVGSGKTIVSFIAILLNLCSGYQSALLAPTEVLARQHYENFTNLFKNVKCELLVGSLTKKEKELILEKLKNNEIDLLIGTHAMLEDNVEFNNLGLVVTDEQHRFGVNQRKCLQNKGRFVDVLYMSATPIPRTYALTIYGDMDISMIKTKPAGRKEIKTKVFGFKDINNVVSYIEDELKESHQAYVVSSLIESDDEETELNDLKKIEDILNNNLSRNYKIGILHGKMKPEQKEKVMDDFKQGKTDILLSTTVIEVGVDVKNATMIAIFNAERFGLATLHQLRGRVGRNSYESKCLLISDKESERLKVLESSNDGFYISEKDFELRGSGDLFGIKQSGDMVFKIADIRKDYKILLQCKKDSEEFILNNIENDFRDNNYYKEILKELMNND